jgi:HK97 family phage major capsid protein
MTKMIAAAALAAGSAALAQPFDLAAHRKAFPRAVRSMPRADAANAAQILASLQKDFSDFKAANDERLNGKADVLIDAKVDKINDSVTALQAAIDDLNKKLAAAQLAGGDGDPKNSPERKAYAAKFNNAFRRGGGSNIDAELHDLAVKAAMTTQSDPDGGWMVTSEMEKTIDRILMNVSAMRGLAQVQPISAEEYKKLVSQGGAIGGWAGETDVRTATANAKLAEIVVEAMELWANPFASQKLLDDASVDLGQWMGDEVSITFAEQEGSAFINGNGVKKPRGILSYPTVADANYAWGKIGFIGTGGAGFAADPGGLDTLIDATYALKKGYRIGSSWLANRKTIGSVRKFKDDQGRYQWEPSSQVGQPPTLLGYPVEDDDNMPDVGAGAFPVAFGDFRRGYLIVDRMGIRVLRDPYTNKPHVGFYTTKRVGGGVQNFEAIKLVKCA